MGLFSGVKEVEVIVPRIELKKKLKKVHISGVSRMPDPGEFYNNFTETLENYFIEFNRTLFIEFNLEYINTGSTKWLFFSLNHLQSLLLNGGLIEITWHYEEDDESIEETGEVLKSQLAIPFTLKPVA
jgi:hypothetical protein